MEVTYKRSLQKSYMCVASQEKVIESYELQMAEGRKIPHLLGMEIIRAEGNANYMYDISGKQQIDDYLSGKKMGYGILWGLLCAVQELCTALPDYLLREDGICLESEYIYVSLEDGGIYFTYFPFWSQSFPEAFERYMEQVLRKVDHQEQAAAELAYQVYQMCIMENTSIRGMLEQVRKKGFLDGIVMEPEKEVRASVMEEPQGQPIENLPQRKQKLWEKLQEKAIGWAEANPTLVKFLDKCKAIVPKGFTGNKPKAETGKLKQTGTKEKTRKVIFKEKGGTRWGNKAKEGKNLSQTELEAKPVKSKANNHIESLVCQNAAETNAGLDGALQKVEAHPTEILGICGQETIGWLAYQGNHGCGDIQVEGEEFLLGKNREQAAGVIDAEGVSRLHARITRQGENFYLEDLNSTNGTFLNGEPVQYRQKRKLSQNDRIRFGAEEYLFS